MIRSVVVSVAVSTLFAAAGETRASLVTYNSDTSELAADAYQFSPDLGDSQSQSVPGAGSFQASSGNSLSNNQYQLDDSGIWVSFHLHQDGSTSVDQSA